jgi:pimeloyl-ACP methyl ester carboxylesterase
VNIGDVAKRTGMVTGVVAGVAGALYAGERAVASRIRRGGPDDSVDEPLAPEIDASYRFATHDGGELYVIERAPTGPGPGTPIVLAHGVTLTSRVWARQFRSLPAAGFRAVAADSRGHGASIAGDTGHSVENLAADLRLVLESLDLRDAVLVGHSMGGMAVQALAVHHPDVVRKRVRGIVLVSTSPRSFASDARRIQAGLDRAVGVVPDVGMLLRQRNLGLLIARIGFGDDPDPSCVEATRVMLGSCSRETMREATRRLLGFDVTKELPSLTVPTLVLVGTADLLTPPRDARAIVALVPGSELIEFPGAGHMLMYERTDELDRLVVEFAHARLDGAGTPPVVRRVAG